MIPLLDFLRPAGAVMKAQAAGAVGSVRCWLLSVAVIAAVAGSSDPSCSQTRHDVAIRGHQQSLYIYGLPQGQPVIVSSGDGGWIHLGPHVAEFLATRRRCGIGSPPSSTNTARPSTTSRVFLK